MRDLWLELPKALGVNSNPVVIQLMSALGWASYRSADRLPGGFQLVFLAELPLAVSTPLKSQLCLAGVV